MDESREITESMESMGTFCRLQFMFSSVRYLPPAVHLGDYTCQNTAVRAQSSRRISKYL